MVNFVSTTYNEIYDISTKTDTATLLGFKAPRSAPSVFFGGLYSCFRWVRYLGQQTIVQALAQLPVDPLKVGEGTADIQQISPKTLANPIMFKGCHGESLNDALNIIYRNTGMAYDGDGMVRFDVPEHKQPELSYEYYYSLLSDNTVKKYANQRSFLLPKMYPLVHKLATLHPIYPNQGDFQDEAGKFMPLQPQGRTVRDVRFNKDGTTTEPQRTPQTSSYQVPTDGNIPQYAFDSHYHSIDTDRLNKNLEVEYNESNDSVANIYGIKGANPYSSDYDLTGPAYLLNNGVVSSGLKRFGWMPTSTFADEFAEEEPATARRVATKFPSMFMGCMILPPTYQDSYKLYFRIYIKHYFQFKGFSTSMQLEGHQQAGEFLHNYHDLTSEKTIESNNANIELINAGVK